MDIHNPALLSEWISPANAEIIEAIHRASAVVTGTANLDETLRSILEICIRHLGYLNPFFVVFDAPGNQTWGRLVCFSDTREALHGVEGVALPSFPLGTFEDEALDLLNRALHVGVPLCMTRDVRSGPLHLRCRSESSPAEDADAVAIMLFALPTRGRCSGVLAVGHPVERQITHEDPLVLQILAGQAAVAIENARLQHDLRDREQQVLVLLKAIIDAQEEERERICLEIHDGVAQTLAPAFQYLQTLSKHVGIEDDVRAKIHKAEALVRDAIREAREVIASLRPAALDTVGLTATLEHELAEARERTGLQIDFEAGPIRFPKEVETALYRIIHEAVNNAIKHARAHHVVVRVRREQDRIVAEIHDDGIGFDVASVVQKRVGKGVGLLSMRKRAELLQGDFDVAGAPGAGTRVRVEVPFPV